MLKILHIVPTYLPAYRYGGPIASVHALNRALVAQKHDVTVFTTNVDGPDNLKVPLGVPQIIDGVKVVYFPVGRFRSWFYSADMRKALAEKTKGYDIVHITSVFLSASALGAHYAKKSGVPYLISPRGSLMKDPLALKGTLKKKIYVSLIERRNLAGAAAIHFTSEAEAAEYSVAGFPARKKVIVPNAFEAGPEEYAEPAAQRAPHFVALGRITEKKGFDTLFPAFKKVKEKIPDAVLVIAGNDERGYEQKARKMAEEEHLSADDVKFLGMVVGEAKSELLRSATAFVLPSYSENFGMAPVEALAHGTAVVITPEVGIAEEVRMAGVGIVARKDVEEFAKAMVEIAKSEAQGKPMGKKGPQFVSEKFSPPKVAEAFEMAYTEIIASWPQKNRYSR